jgi:hypothetical protein
MRRKRRASLPAAIGLAIGAVIAFAGWPGQASAAGVSVDLDQWASLSLAWQNGDLNGNNARYPEGGVIPFRLAIEKLAPGNHSLVISYDFTASGHKAYDFLATWNATNHPGLCVPSGGAISTMCPGLPASSSAAIPSDPYTANGLTVRGAEAWSGVPRRLTIFGGTITSIGQPAHSGSVNGNSEAEILVRFRSTGSAVLLAWGGHLAQSSYWDSVAGGPLDGARMVSGAPWHMRTLNLDGGGARNQDRSIQPSAVVGELPPAGASATPRPSSPPSSPPSGGGSSRGGGSPSGGQPAVTLPPTETMTATPSRRADAWSSAWVPIVLAVSFAVALAGVTIAGKRSAGRHPRG